MKQREIKFRAWLCDQKKMLYDFRGWFDMPEGRMVCIETEDSYYTDDFERLDKKEAKIMQYTGLKDKNGKEIYQGDLLRVNNKNYDPEYELFYEGIVEVTRKTCGFGLEMVNPIPKEYEWDSSSLWHVGEGDTTEVIGNIYEDKELLK